MNLRFSLERAAGYSGGSYSAGEPSVPLRSMSIVAGYSCSARMTACLSRSRFGLTCGPSTGDPGLDAWISSLPDSRARTSVSPDAAPDSMECRADFGRMSHLFFALYDRVMSSWRTAQRSLLGASDECSVIWPRWGLMRAGVCWPLPTWAPRTSENGSGYSLPTPTAGSYGTNQGGAAGRVGKVRPSLETMAGKWLWPTPLAGDGKRGRTGWTDDGKRGHQLPEMAARVPTPTSSMVTMADMAQARYSGADPRRPSYQEARKRLWPTPRSASKNGGGIGLDGGSGARERVRSNEGEEALKQVTGGALNARWVEWLMGWPIGWASLEPVSLRTVSEWMECCRAGAWWDTEPDIPRTVMSIKGRRAQLKALGNGQVPMCAALAFRTLTEHRL